MLNINSQLQLAIQQHQKNNLINAEEIYKKIISINPKHYECLYLLGTLYAQQNKFNLSISFLNKSIKLNKNNQDAYYNLGNVYQNLNVFEKAILNYKSAIKINNKYLKALLNLGHIYYIQKNFKKSINSYLEILKFDNNYTDALNNLGTVYAEIKNNTEALKYFNKAVVSDHKNFRSYYNLATLYSNKRDYLNAVEYFKKAIKNKSLYPSAYNGLGYAYKKLDKFNEAKKNYEISIEQDPKYVLAKLNYGNLLDIMGEHKKAIAIYSETIKINPNMLSARWASLNTFPMIYKNTEEISEYTHHFSNEIQNIEKFISKNKVIDKKEVIKGLLNSTNFYLHYQGIDNTNLQKKYANVIETLTNQIYSIKKIKKEDEDKIKIGFVSPCFIEHSVSNTHKNFYLKLNKNKFKTYIYHINDEKDEYTKYVAQKTFSFYHSSDVDKIIKKISEDTLDILFFIDIGMDPKMQILGSLRFAKIQINGNAQPITSGFKNMDYVISSTLMEPINGQKHYTEKLIKLSNSGQCYEQPKISIERNENKEKIIFFNLQNLFKLLPDEDQIYIDIIKNIKNCEIWFMKARNTRSTEFFISRLYNIFEKNNLDIEQYIKFKKRRSQKEFFKLINKSDIIIDSLNWSGNNTSHQAIALAKPIITLPGPFMRSRHTYALLKQININETIAKNREDYIKIAIKLSKDKDYYIKLINRIEKNNNLLFNDESPIRELEDILIKLIKK